MSQACPEVWLTKLENSTTGIDLLKKKSSDSACRVAGISHQGFQIILPKGSCPRGHFVLIDCVVQLNGQQYSMQATGQVQTTIPNGEQILVWIEFKNFDQKLWEKLTEDLSNRQTRATEIFESIKGTS